MMAWLAQAWWLWQIGVILFIVVAFWTLGSTHPDREKRRQRRSIDLPPSVALALGIALAVEMTAPIPVLKPSEPVAPPVIVPAPIEGVPTDSEARELAAARSDQRRFDLECLMFAVDPTKCEPR